MTTTGADAVAPASEKYDAASSIYSQAGNENFPVASRLLPRDVRADFMALYGFARLIDDTGDEAPGDRSATLDRLEQEVRAAAAGPDGPGADSLHPVMRRLAATIGGRQLPLQPFLDLVEANRMDQRVRRYQTYDELVGYCRLSANPVGRLVLGILGVATPGRIAWSDDVCTGLQIVEHLQDVAEDLAQDRIYLPLDDLAAHGCTEADRAAPSAGPALRQVVALEAGRARTLLGSGVSLAYTLPLRPRFAISAFSGGGLAALDGLKAAGYDVLARPSRPSKVKMAVRAVQLFAEATRPKKRLGAHTGGAVTAT